ncbi:hypothetical protein LINPERHAP1_LOCUS27288 [Linum perenne]
MAPFDFKSATHFVASSDGITLQVYEFTEPTNNPSSIQKPHFKHVAKICHETSKEEGGAKTTSSYDALLFPEDHGRIEGREGLTMLAQHLAQLHLVVSPQGYCFQDVDLEIHYLRLNDLFCWSHHGVESMASTTNTVWTRSELKHPVRKAKDEEVKKLRKEKHAVSVAKNEEVEKKQPSWAFLPSTKLVRQNSETKQKYLERRQRVPPGTFSLFTNFGFPYVSNSANLVDNMSVNSMEYVNLIDEPESNIKEWPPLPTQYVYIGKGSTLDFDTNDWWYLKTTHPEGGLTMLVYYEGKRSQFSHGDKDTDPIIPLPFLKDAQVYSILSKFSLFNLSFGARLGYMYRK